MNCSFVCLFVVSVCVFFGILLFSARFLFVLNKFSALKNMNNNDNNMNNFIRRCLGLVFYFIILLNTQTVALS